MIMMSRKIIVAFNSPMDGWLSRAQNGAKVSYSPASQSKIAHLLPHGRMVNRSQISPSWSDG
jgi:accessory colonization factor AcfC